MTITRDPAGAVERPGREAALVAVERAAPGRTQRQVPLGRFSAYKVGGPAELLVEPETSEELERVIVAAHEASLPVFSLGGGTNLLVREGGIPGVVLRLGNGFANVSVQGTEVTGGSMAPMSRVAMAAERAALEGLEFGFDIPGTVGGALAMNAGAHGSEIRNVLLRARGVDPAGRPVTDEVSEIHFGYRTAVYPVRLIFTEGVFGLRPGNAEVLAERRQKNHDFRKRTQPKGRTVGSVFKNPPGDHAGRLIDAAGLKGFRLGGAVVSEKHANWIVSDRDASPSEIESLIRHIQARVRERFGVELEPEVRIVGEQIP